MKEAPRKIRVLLFMAIMLLFMAPFVENKFHFSKLKPLSGAITEPEKKYFSMKDWFSGEYQKQEETYLNESFGFRSFFVRLNNQIAYSLFKTTSAKNVVIGKNGMLFEENYIRAYYGRDFVGNDSIQHRMQKLKFIQDTLQKLNKSLILIFAPGKASFFPELIPDSCLSEKSTTNYDVHIKLAKEYGLNYIDFNSYFIEHKNNTPYPLYPQCGIHWSHYGACLVADSIIRYMEALRKIDMPNLFWTEVEMSDPKDEDNDIGDGMNLFYGLKPYKLAYPNLQMQSESGKTKPSVLVVADSYYWGMYKFGISDAFGNNHFWFYDKEVYPESYKTGLKVDQLNLGEQISHHDVIIIMATQPTLPDLGWGFIEKLYGYYKR